MHDDRTLTERRLARVLDQRLRPAVHVRSLPLEVSVHHLSGEPVPVSEGIAGSYEPISTGEYWGPAWSTSWFRIRGCVPVDWAGERVEAVLDLGFGATQPGFSAEGLVYRADGTPVKALNPRNTWLLIAERAEGGAEVEFYIEAAANPLIFDFDAAGDPFVPTRAGDVASWLRAGGGAESAGEPLYRLTRTDLAVFDETVWELVQDLDVLSGLMHQLPEDATRRSQIRHTVSAALDAIDLQDIKGTAGQARTLLAPALSAPAHAGAHRISAVGHAHIDTAWLWPVRETVRKAARTVSNVTALMDDHPDFRFVMSQAQQLAWLKEQRPEVYARVLQKVATGQFLPTGSLWVEPDTNLSGGESLVRQFVHGKRFYLEEFGLETRDMWLPDTFGYNAALPQLMKLAGIDWFLTQKISWNTTNAFPHHTFWWEGIDGSRVFSHFPPVDSYNGDLSGADIGHTERNFRDKGAANRSLVPFGYGDGGGGPTREMLARADRLANLEGSAKVEMEGPVDFFTKAHAEYPDAPVWVGELYLELHRGTLTSQLATKQGNRRSEHLLREAELWSATAALRAGEPYPYAALDRIWKTVLLHQFHDILPGSSIAWVHRETEQAHQEVARELNAVIDTAQRALAGPAEADGGGSVVFNAAPHGRDGVPALAATLRTAPLRTTPVRAGQDGSLVLDNGLVRITVDARGLITSAYDLTAGREALAPGAAGNLFQLHQDFPNQWDAWDVDAFYRNTVQDLTQADEVTAPHDTIEIVWSVNQSRIRQQLTLREGARRLDIDITVDWREREKILKAAFPFDIRASDSTSEIPFGHVRRPTHSNTSWDAARFEICAHRFLHIEEPGWGVALVNDSTYGHDVTRDVRPDGGTTTTVRLSLLRAPLFPDPEADQGEHRLRYGLVIGADIGDAVREGYRFNLAERTVAGSTAVAPLAEVDHNGAVIEAVKLADDRSGDVIVRLYESLGGRTTTTLRAGFPVMAATTTDLLERPVEDRPDLPVTDGGVHLVLRPFQILTVRLTPRT
ncbi:glycoside hydrolase family 38 C-terminal domain-containing protein [Streptomyces sp. ADI93-02]|uniref:alpha-mannosidase n=1 Tax=Streptomyces sp. ADI93-02 TaxID=1522757 RepID=UPI000F552AFA|nr:glycoside hydrolase family 38 C-terminal domain-containing protein [Streptomyces sp. ADI93-02]RPK36121.1 Mannosylglycerate hydrolase [Streptomyces sp. ADI93-02]